MVEDYIANDILEKGLPLGGVTVLYSSANQLPAITAALRGNGIKADVVSSTEIPEVIVAKQVSYPDKPKGKILFFDNIFRYIRSRFDETFREKAVSNL